MSTIAESQGLAEMPYYNESIPIHSRAPDHERDRYPLEPAWEYYHVSVVNDIKDPPPQITPEELAFARDIWNSFGPAYQTHRFRAFYHIMRDFVFQDTTKDRWQNVDELIDEVNQCIFNDRRSFGRVEGHMLLDMCETTYDRPQHLDGHLKGNLYIVRPHDDNNYYEFDYDVEGDVLFTPPPLYPIDDEALERLAAQYELSYDFDEEAYRIFRLEEQSLAIQRSAATA